MNEYFVIQQKTFPETSFSVLVNKNIDTENQTLQTGTPSLEKKTREMRYSWSASKSVAEYKWKILYFLFTHNWTCSFYDITARSGKKRECKKLERMRDKALSELQEDGLIDVLKVKQGRGYTVRLIDTREQKHGQEGASENARIKTAAG